MSIDATKKDNIEKMRYPEAAQFLGVSQSYLRQQVMKKMIPHYKMGKIVIFDKSTLDTHMKKFEVRPVC